MTGLLKQSTARNLAFLMVDSSDHVTGKTGLTVTVTLSKDAAAFAAAGGSVTEISSGWYKIALNTTDTGTLGDLAIHCAATGADPTDFKEQVVAFDVGDTVRLGLIALPNVAAEAAGGLYTRGSGAGQINQNANGQVDSRTVTMATDVITAAAIQADAIGAAEIANGAIDAATFAAGAIDAAAIATDAIGSAELAATAASEIATAVAAAVLATPAQLLVTDASGRVTVGSIAANVITATAIAADAITAAKVADGTIDAATFAAGAINAAAIATDAITAAKIAADAIGASELAADAVTEIQSGLATSAALATVQADTDDIQTRLPAALVSGRMDSSTGAMAAGVVTAAAVATNAIDADALATDAVTEIAAGVAVGSAPTAAQNATAVRTELATELARIDVATSTRAAGGVGGVIGSGSSAYAVTVTQPDNVTPIEGVAVWVSTDAGGTNVVAGTLYTDTLGRINTTVGFMLDPGGYWLWRQHGDWTFANPTSFTVT